MFIEESKTLNKSEIISINNIYENQEKKYYNTTIKKKKSCNYSDSKNQNLLINALRHFSVKFELEEQKTIKNQKYVITFDELISLIKFVLEAQVKLNTNLITDFENEKKVSQEFINNLAYYIYSYEKVEKINPNEKSRKDIKSPLEKENININLGKKRSKKPIKIMNKSQSYLDNGKKIKKIKNRKKENNEEYEKENDKNKNKNECIQVTKSYYRRNNGQNLFSSEKNISKDIKNKSVLNRSVEKRHNTIFSDTTFKSKENSTKKKLNKSTEKRKSVNVLKKKNDNKCLSIFTACENMKSSSYIFNNKKCEFASTEKYDKKDNKKKINNHDTNNNINNKKENKKIVHYNQNMMLGVKKQVITSNVPKPSNLANKLLQNGRKYITEFNGIKEEERKKQYYS